MVTGRTLVLPAATGWYLIDWGPKGAKQDERGVRAMEMDGRSVGGRR